MSILYIYEATYFSTLFYPILSGLDKNEEEPENYPRILQTTTVQLQLFDGCNTDVYDDDLRKDIQICCGVRGGGRDICKVWGFD